MISSFIEELNELEKKMETNEKNLEELILDRGVENIECREPQPNFSKEVFQKLLGFQGALKDHRFEMNSLSSRVRCQEEELQQLRSDVQRKISREGELVEMFTKLVTMDVKIDNTPTDCNTIVNVQKKLKQDVQCECIVTHDCNDCDSLNKMQLNPEAAEFKPRFIAQTLQFAKVTPTPPKQPLPQTTKGACNLKSENDWSNTNEYAVSVLQLQSKANKIKYLQQIENVTKNDQQAQSQKEDNKPTTNIEIVEPNELNPEVSMQQKLYEKNRAIFEIESRLEDALNREAEMAQQLTQAENKIRLLKHDKRRRGETIGKLLHCRDDLKNIEKIDRSSGSLERVMLNTALSTRGMAHDDRIQVAINVTEAEGLQHYRPIKNQPRFLPDGMETPDIEH